MILLQEMHLGPSVASSEGFPRRVSGSPSILVACKENKYHSSKTKVLVAATDCYIENLDLNRSAFDGPGEPFDPPGPPGGVHGGASDISGGSRVPLGTWGPGRGP